MVKGDPVPVDSQRRLGLASATALVVGEVLGVGIFLTPAGMAHGLGSPALLMAVWLAGGAITFCGALSLGELAARFPEAGGPYAFLRHAYGPRLAFLYGWMSLLVLDPGLTASLAVGVGTYASELVPLTPAGRSAVAVGVIALVALTNALGVAIGSGLLRGLTILKIALLVFLAIWGFGLGRGDWDNLLPFLDRRPGSEPLAGALVGAAIAAFFSFGGWWDAAKLVGEVREPSRTMPRALLIGVTLVTSLYILVSLVFLYLVPLAEVTSDRGFAAQAGAALFGRLGGQILAAIVVLMVLGSLSAITLAAPRVYAATARDGYFPPILGRVGRRGGAPIVAVTTQAVLSSALALTGTFEQILAYFIAPAIAFLLLIVASVYVLRRRSAGQSDFVTPGYPWTPLVFLVPVSGVLILLAASEPIRTAIGAAVVLAGLPVFFVFSRAARTRVDARPSDAA